MAILIIACHSVWGKIFSQNCNHKFSRKSPCHFVLLSQYAYILVSSYHIYSLLFYYILQSVQFQNHLQFELIVSIITIHSVATPNGVARLKPALLVPHCHPDDWELLGYPLQTATTRWTNAHFSSAAISSHTKLSIHTQHSTQHITSHIHWPIHMITRSFSSGGIIYMYIINSIRVHACVFLDYECDDDCCNRIYGSFAYDICYHWPTYTIHIITGASHT